MNNTQTIQRPKVAASPLEMEKLNSAICALSGAKKATNENDLIKELQSGYKTIREILRSRIL